MIKHSTSKDVVKLIVSERIRQKLSQQVLAEELDISLRTYQRWEQLGTMGLDELFRVCEILDIRALFVADYVGAETVPEKEIVPTPKPVAKTSNDLAQLLANKKAKELEAIRAKRGQR